MRATAFGIDLEVDRELPFLHTPATAATGRVTKISLAPDGGNAGPSWDSTEAELISDQRGQDGEIVFQIERNPIAAHRIWGPTYGGFVLSANGGDLRGAPGSGGIIAWQRLLVAQALPFAAALHGLEVFHASAVAIEGGAVALIGPSGAGKTSLALELQRRGAEFLADDVLAIERVGDGLIAHPGTAVAGIARAEAERLSRAGLLVGSPLAVDQRERMQPTAIARAALPLRAIFFLDRRRDGPGAPRFEAAVEARGLLAATFNLLLCQPARLSGLLDTCAIAARGLVERICVVDRLGAAELAGAIERRLAG